MTLVNRAYVEAIRAAREQDSQQLISALSKPKPSDAPKPAGRAAPSGGDKKKGG